MPLKRIGRDGTERSAPRGFSFLESIVVVAITITIVGIRGARLLELRTEPSNGGDSRNLAGMIAEAKMRAAADFTHARVYANLSGNSYHLEVWNKSGNGGAGCWQTDGDIERVHRRRAARLSTFPATSPSATEMLALLPQTRNRPLARRPSATRAMQASQPTRPPSPIPPASSSIRAACLPIPILAALRALRERRTRCDWGSVRDRWRRGVWSHRDCDRRDSDLVLRQYRQRPAGSSAEGHV